MNTTGKMFHFWIFLMGIIASPFILYGLYILAALVYVRFFE